MTTVPVALNHRVTPNFMYGELIKSETAIRRGISNVPGEDEYAALVSVCENVMEPTRAAFGVPLIVTSAYRSRLVNRLVGGSRRSQHIKGQAIDFEPLHTFGVYDLWYYIVTSDLPFDQCILEFPPGGWVHVSHVADGPNRGKITVAKHDLNGKTVYTHYTVNQIREGEHLVG